jgi:hypothetical protein
MVASVLISLKSAGALGKSNQALPPMEHSYVISKWLVGATVITAGYFSKEQATKDEGEDPSAGADEASVPTSQVEEDDDGCTAMAMKKHNAVAGHPSDNDASDSDDNDEEEELSIELSETHCQSAHPFHY